MYKGDLSYKLGRLIIALSNDSIDISPELHKRAHSDPDLRMNVLLQFGMWP